MVNIIFKTLQRETFTYDLELTSTVGAMKQKLHVEKDFPLNMNLVFAGKVLKENDKTIEAVGLGADKTVVIAAKAVPKETKAAAPEATSTKSVTPEAEAKPAADEGSPSGTAPSGGDAPTPIAPELAEAHAALMAMTGADAEKVKRALILAQGNPDMAAELLFSGQALPDPAALAQQQQQEPQGTPAGSSDSTGAAAGGVGQLGPEQMELVQILRQPQFVQLREEVINNSDQLEPLLEQLGTAKPDILRLINNNQELFLEFLYGGAGGGMGERQVVQVTAEEKAAIERLEQMGFRRDLVLQAYFACEKDENLAAEFLLSQPREDW